MAASSKNTSFESSSHYEDINVTSKEYAVNNGDASSDCRSDGSTGVRRIKYPKVLPDFPSSTSAGVSTSAERRLSLPPPTLAGIPEGGTKIPPPPPPRISSTLGRKRDQTAGRAEAMVAVPFDKRLQPDAIPEEPKSLVVPCVPNKVCPVTAPPVRRPVEPRIVIKASSVQHQNPQHPNPQHQQKQPSKRTNIPRVVHPQNSDRTGKTGEGDTGTVKRKKK